MLPIYLNTKYTLFNRIKGLQRWLKLIGIFSLAIYLIPSFVHAQPKMSKLEYYIDIDPGYGNAVPVALDTTLTDFIDYNVPINVTGLATGNHTFWIRGLDKNGSWSMMNGWDFTVTAVLAAPSIVVNSITHKTTCSADSFNISFDRTGTYNAGNVFNVELSDAAGSFTSPTVIGSYSGTNNAIVKVKLPAHMAEGMTYKLRVNSTNPVVTGVATEATIIIHDRPTSQTITGADNAMTGASFPYSVPSFTGSTWTWLVPDASITQTGNSANLEFNVQGLQTIKVIETNQFGCIGDTSSKNVIVMGALPVTYVSFTASAQTNKVVLQWSTAIEINSVDFKVQRSFDGINFETIASIPAAGTSSSLRTYRFDDLQSISLKGKVIFFRIIETDIDGKLVYTNVKKIKISDVKNKFTLDYNPVRNEALLNYDCTEKDEVLISIVDHLGRNVMTEQLQVFAGSNQIKLQTGNLAKGIYEVVLKGSKDQCNVRMMKE